MAIRILPIGPLLIVALLLITPISAVGQQGQVIRQKVHSPAMEDNLLGNSADRDVAIYLPPSYQLDRDRRFPVVYVLHGYFAPIDLTKLHGLPIQVLMDSLIQQETIREMILVCPNASGLHGGSQYANSTVSGKWADFIVHDLVAYVDKNYRTLARAESRGLTGSSMGGRGALDIAAKYPNVFDVVYARSSGQMAFHRFPVGTESEWKKLLSSKDQRPRDWRLGRLLGFSVAFSPNPDSPPNYADLPMSLHEDSLRPVEKVRKRWAAFDPVQTVEQHANALRKLRALHFDCGTSDKEHNIKANRMLSALLTQHKVPHVFEEYEGGHSDRQAERIRTRVLPTFSSTLDFEVNEASEEWRQFRGPGGMGSSNATDLPVNWSSKENIVWKTDLPGPGSSSPVVVNGRVYLTCYSGYGLEPNEGNKDDLMRHVVCVNRETGDIAWTRDFTPKLPETTYQSGNDSQHGYSSSTPASDGDRLYVFFGKSGVYCLDMEGNQLWHTSIGNRVFGWGSSNSPVLYKNLVIINASVESGSLVALDKMTGEEVWRVEDMESSWNTPLLVDVSEGKAELVVLTSGHILGFDPEVGRELWRCKAFDNYICPSPVGHNGIVYAIQASSLAIRAGGRGDVSGTHKLWQSRGSSIVPSPVYHDGHIYWIFRGIVHCLRADNGHVVYQERLRPKTGTVYASVIVADGKLFCVSQHNGTYVVAAKPEFEFLAHNTFEDDDSRTNASPIVDEGQLLLRNDQTLYCIGRN